MTLSYSKCRKSLVEDLESIVYESKKLQIQTSKN